MIIAFDIETSKVLEPEADLQASRPLGISCAAVVNDVIAPIIFHGAHEPGHKCYAAKMSVEECRAFADLLIQRSAWGWKIITWNGVGFDFSVLAEECDSADYTDRLAAVALASIDPGFTMLCEKGYMIGLQAAAIGAGLPGKTEGMDGLLATTMWQESREQQNKVLEYVEQDALTTVRVYLAIRRSGRVLWTSKAGKKNAWMPRFDSSDHMLTAAESMKLPLPDTSWMSAPMKRSQFTSWMEGV